jgi:hypothetical protein
MSIRRRREDVDFATTRIVLAANAPDLLETLRLGALRAEVDPARFIVCPTGAAPEPDDAPPAGLAVIAVRRAEDDPPFRRALQIATRLAPGLDPKAVQLAITIPAVVRLAPKIERRITEEMIHQLDLAGAVSTGTHPWRDLRLRAGLATLRAAGVRVFRLKVRA